MSCVPARWLKTASQVAIAVGMMTAIPFHYSTLRAEEEPPLLSEEFLERSAQLEQSRREAQTKQQRLNTAIVPLIAAVPPSPEGDVEETEEERRIGSVVEKYVRRLQSMPSEQKVLEQELRLAQQDLKIAEQDAKIAALQDSIKGLGKPPSGKDAKAAFGNDGLFITSADGNFKTHIGGVVQMDYIGMGPASSGVTVPNAFALQDSTTFRRLRLRAEGTMWSNIDYVAEYDFALALQNTDPGITGTNNSANPANGLQGTTTHGGTGIQSGNTTNVAQPTTIFVTIHDVPIVNNMRIGNQQDWFSMEHIESARFLDFMERAPIMDAFAGPSNNGYTPGISMYDNTEDKNLGWQFGIYKNNAYDSGFTYSIGNAWAYGGRLIYTPYYDEESNGRYLVHTGLGVEYRSFSNTIPAANQGTNIRVRSRGDLRNASSVLDPNYADTGNFFTQGQTMICPELAIQLGPLLLRSEFVANYFQGVRPFQGSTIDLGTCFMYGGYAEALYFLTGENRVYNRQSGVFGRVIPKENLKFNECRYGAWQIGTRFDYLNLNAKGINGGQSNNLTLGLNWFLNPNLRFQVNYVAGWINNAGPSTLVTTNGALVGSKFTGDGVVNSVGTRIDWTY